MELSLPYSVELALPYIYVLAVVLSAFGVFGYFRGWAREASALVGQLVSWALVITWGALTLAYMNKVYRALLFLVQGGIEAEDPSVLAKEINGVRLIDTEHPEPALSVLFIVLTIVGYLIVNRLVERKTSVPGSAVGALLGVANGYLLAGVLLNWPSYKANLVVTVNLPDETTAAFLSQYFPAALIVVIGIIIVGALINSLRNGRRSSAQSEAASLARRRG